MSSDGRSDRISRVSRISRISEDVVAVRDQLTSDLKAEKRRMVIIAVLLVVINVVVFYGFSQINGFMKEYATPKSITEFAENTLKRAIPDLGETLSRSLQSSAPQLVDKLKTQLLREALPALRREGEQQLLGLTEAAIVVAEREMEATIGAVIANARAEVLASAATEAASAPDALARTLERVVRTELRQRITDRPGEPLSAQLETARRQLLGINAKLKRLASGQGLSRSETLQRRLLESWIGLVNQKGGGLTSSP